MTLRSNKLSGMHTVWIWLQLILTKEKLLYTYCILLKLTSTWVMCCVSAWSLCALPIKRISSRLQHASSIYHRFFFSDHVHNKEMKGLHKSTKEMSWITQLNEMPVTATHDPEPLFSHFLYAAMRTDVISSLNHILIMSALCKSFPIYWSVSTNHKAAWLVYCH